MSKTEAWAFRILAPLMVGLLALIWKDNGERLKALEVRSQAHQDAITKLEVRTPAGDSVVSKDTLSLTVKPITDRLDALDRRMAENADLQKEQTQLMRVLVQQGRDTADGYPAASRRNTGAIGR